MDFSLIIRRRLLTRPVPRQDRCLQTVAGGVKRSDSFARLQKVALATVDGEKVMAPSTRPGARRGRTGTAALGIVVFSLSLQAPLGAAGPLLQQPEFDP